MRNPECRNCPEILFGKKLLWKSSSSYRNISSLKQAHQKKLNWCLKSLLHIRNKNCNPSPPFRSQKCFLFLVQCTVFYLMLFRYSVQLWTVLRSRLRSRSKKRLVACRKTSTYNLGVCMPLHRRCSLRSLLNKHHNKQQPSYRTIFSLNKRLNHSFFFFFLNNTTMWTILDMSALINYT